MSKLIDFLAEQVKSRRQAIGVSQEQFAEQTGLSIALISEIERGIANPTLSTLEKISSCLNVRLAELLDMDGVVDNTEHLKRTLQHNVEQLPSKQLKILLLIVQLLNKK